MPDGLHLVPEGEIYFALIEAAHKVQESRLEVTKLAMPELNISSWPQTTPDSSSFFDLVTELYKVFKEIWEKEISFLAGAAQVLGIAPQPILTSRAAVHYLRTAKQHADNEEAAAQSRSWFQQACGAEQPAEPEDWARCGAKIVKDASTALECLSALADAAALNPQVASDWQRMADRAESLSPESQLDIIAEDLGIAIAKSRGYLSRQTQSSWTIRQRSLTAADDAEFTLTQVVQTYLVGWSLSDLPCHYQQILEEFGCQRGGIEALSAIRFAHAMADLLDYSSDQEFLEKLLNCWQELKGTGLLPDFSKS